MSDVGAYEAKTHLPDLLDRVERGELITITRHGRAVAQLVPVEPPSRVEEAIDSMLAFRRALEAAGRHGIDVRELVEEGRR